MIAKIKRKMYRILKYYQEYGMIRFIRHTFVKLFGLEEMNYKRWRKKCQLSRQELECQSIEKFLVEPMFSIVIPLFCTSPQYLQELIKSIQNQTYKKWELCLSDGSGSGNMDLTFLHQIMRLDNRIKLYESDISLSISANTNQALKLVEGDYIVFVDHDDLLSPNALYECVKIINAKPDIDVIYSDEDKVSMDGKKFFQPHFKSDFNLDLLRSMNYICHMFVVRTEIQKKAGILKEEFNGAQDYDFIFRCIEISKKIVHIPKILYHWRAHKDSTAENPESKNYAFEAGKRAIKSHLDRCQIDGQVEMGEYKGLYHIRYGMQEEPLLSILIPSKDHWEDLERCLISLYEVSDYQKFEIIIIENGSVMEETLEFYDKILKEHENIKILNWENSKEFNYSALNNFGAGVARGKYLLFLNNDTQIIARESIREMLSYATRDDVGAVGARLYYPDGTIQHAGVILGLGGIAGHAFQGFEHNANGYFSRILCAQDCSAVTAACMMVPKELFDKVGGFDERLKVAFNDIDLCMKLRGLGKLIVYTPFAELYHFESKSRGQENTKEKIKRFNSEVEYFASKWKEELKKGDPYYNPNLTLEKHDFSLRIL